MAISYPRRNGFLYSFQSFSLLEGAELFKGIQAVKFSPKIEGKKIVFGSGRKGAGRVRGQLMVEASITFLADAFFEFVRTRPFFLDQEFDLVGVCEEGSRRDKIEIIGLSFDSVDLSFEGTDETKGECPGNAYDLLINGVSVVEGDALGVSGDGGAA